MQTTKLDQCQFANRRHHPVEAHATSNGWESTRISFEDAARMHVQTRKAAAYRRNEVPVWAVNRTALRECVVVFMERRAQAGAGTGTLEERLAHAITILKAREKEMAATLTKRCAFYVELKQDPNTDRKQLSRVAREIEGLDSQLCLQRGDDCGVGRILRVLQLYYGVGMDSVQVGAEVGIKPPHARQILWRMAKAWGNIQAGTHRARQCRFERLRPTARAARKLRVAQPAAQPATAAVVACYGRYGTVVVLESAGTLTKIRTHGEDEFWVPSRKLKQVRTRRTLC